LKTLKDKYEENQEYLNIRINKCGELSGELSNFKENSKQKDLDNEKLRELLKQKEFELEIFTTQNADTVNEYNKVKEYLRQRDIELDRVMTGNADLKIENDRLNKYILDKGTEIDSMKRTATDANFETKFKDSEIDRLRNEVKEKNVEMNNYKLHSVNQKNENREVSDRLRFASNDYETVLQDNKRLEIDLKGLRDTLTNRDVNVGILKADSVKKDQDITLQQRNFATNESKLNKAQTDLDEMRRKLIDEKAQKEAISRTSKNKIEDLTEQLENNKKQNTKNSNEIKKLNETMKNFENSVSNISSSKQMVEYELVKQKNEMSNIKNKFESAIKHSNENTPVKSRLTSPARSYIEDDTVNLEIQIDRFLTKMLELEKTNKELLDKIKNNDSKSQANERLLSTPSKRYSSVSPRKSNLTVDGSGEERADFKKEYLDTLCELNETKESHEKLMVELAVAKNELEKNYLNNQYNTNDSRTSPRFAEPEE